MGESQNQKKLVRRRTGTTGPISWGEFDAPEVGRRIQNLDADTLSFIRSVAEKNDPAFLFFFGDRIDECELDAHFERFIQVQQSPVSAHHYGLAVLPETAAL